MKQHILKKAVTALMAAVMLAGGAPTDSYLPGGALTTQAAENPSIAKKMVKLANRKTKKIKVKGTKKKISVSSSDRSVAKASRSGKTAFKIKAAKKKKGIAVIQVKTSVGFRYVLVKVGGGTYMSEKTKQWAIAGGYINSTVEKNTGSTDSRPAGGSTVSPTTDNSKQGNETATPSTNAALIKTPDGRYEYTSAYDCNTGHTLEEYEEMIDKGVILTIDQGEEYNKLLDSKVYTLDELPELEAKIASQGGGGTPHEQDELERLRQLKKDIENKPFKDLVESYRQYAKDYDLQILKQCGYGTKSPLEVLTNFQDFMSRNFYYKGEDPDNHYGVENDYFFYPDLWQALKDNGYVESKHLATGNTCIGAAEKIGTIAVTYYGYKTKEVTMQEHSGGYDSHVGTAVLLPQGWYVFEPGHKYPKYPNGDPYDEGFVTGPYTSSSTGIVEKTIYERILNQNPFLNTDEYYYWVAWPYKA